MDSPRPSPPSLSTVAIVGAGAVGTALAHAFGGVGVRVAAVASRTPERATALAASLRGVAAVPVAEAAQHAPVVLLTVTDSSIEGACAALGAGTGTLVAHVSGSRDVSALRSAAAAGAEVGSFHPLAAVIRAPDPAAAPPEHWRTIFSGAAFAIEGTPAVREVLAPLAVALGGHPFPIRAADKARYHLGASILAAFSAGLAQVTWDGLRAAGAPDAVASAGVGHLLGTVARNVAAAPTPASALTGPVARGDAGGVTRQANAALALPPAAAALYFAHVRHNISLALSAGRIDEARAAELRAALEASAPAGDLTNT